MFFALSQTYQHLYENSRFSKECKNGTDILIRQAVLAFSNFNAIYESFCEIYNKMHILLFFFKADDNFEIEHKYSNL